MNIHCEIASGITTNTLNSKTGGSTWEKEKKKNEEERLRLEKEEEIENETQNEKLVLSDYIPESYLYDDENGEMDDEIDLIE